MLRTTNKLHTNSGRTLALAITAVISLSAFGQGRLWLNTGNAAGLATYTTDGSDTLSHYIPSTNKAWLGAGVSMGKFHSVDEGKTEYQMGAGAKAAYRLNRQTVLAGGVSYIHGEKRNAAGSVWFRPQEAPFNITETSDSTRGNKNSDTYNIWGALCYNVSNAFTLGVGADFTAANYAKQKDPRQKDNYLDFTISPGFMWRLGGGFALGLNYTYRRTMENMTFRLAGRQDKVYEYLIDRGAYFGRTETTDGAGYTDDSFEKPLLDESHGAGLQLEIDFGRATWLNQLDYYHRHGHYGEESQAQIQFSRHSGDGFNYDSWLEFHERQKDMIHGLQLHVDYEKVTTRERVYRSETSESGVTDIHYYGSRESGRWQKGSVRLSYQYDPTGEERGYDMLSNQPAAWSFFADAGYSYRNTTASLYPFYRQQKLHDFGISARAKYVRPVGDVRAGGSLSLGMLFGGGDKAIDGDCATPANGQTRPQTPSVLLDRSYEYATATRLNAAIGVYVYVPVSAGHYLKIHPSYSLQKAFGIDYLEGSARNEVRLTVEYGF